MPKYLLILGGADLDKRTGNKDLAPKMFESFMTWLRSMKESGQYIDSFKLYDQTGTRLSVRGGQVVEGPFVETKEAVGGIFLIQAASLEEANTVARACPTLSIQNGFVEVRAVEEVRPPAGG